MATKTQQGPKVWSLKEFASLVQVDERTLQTWGGKTKLGRELKKKHGDTRIDLVTIGQVFVKNNSKSQAVMAARGVVVPKPKKAAPSPKPQKAAKVEAKASVVPKGVEVKKDLSIVIPSALLWNPKASEEDQLISKENACKFLGVTRNSLDELRLPFELIGEKSYLLASYVLDRKRELDVEARLKTLLKAA
jgi:hypothetical protein